MPLAFARRPATAPPAPGTHSCGGPSYGLLNRSPFSAPIRLPSWSNARSSLAFGPALIVYVNGPWGIAAQSIGAPVVPSPVLDEPSPVLELVLDVPSPVLELVLVLVSA